ncbi:MAG: hypothetical protein AAGN66_04970 [Acidobacteriota bacterium]
MISIEQATVTATPIVVVLVVSTFLTVLSADTVAAEDRGCRPSAPETLQLWNRTGTSLSEDAAHLICSGTISATGDGAWLFLTPGTTATVHGSEGVVYAVDGSSVALHGEGNIVYAATGAGIVDYGDNRIVRCSVASSALRARCRRAAGHYDPTADGARDEDDDLLSGLRTATGALQDLARGAQNAADGMVVEAESDPDHQLIGTWGVVSGELGDQPVATRGKIIFYRDGNAFRNFEVEIEGFAVPQLGPFSWRTEGERIVVQEVGGDPLVWRRLKDGSDRQVISLSLGDGQRAVLELVRLR